MHMKLRSLALPAWPHSANTRNPLHRAPGAATRCKFPAHGPLTAPSGRPARREDQPRRRQVTCRDAPSPRFGHASSTLAHASCIALLTQKDIEPGEPKQCSGCSPTDTEAAAVTPAAQGIAWPEIHQSHGKSRTGRRKSPLIRKRNWLRVPATAGGGPSDIACTEQQNICAEGVHDSRFEPRSLEVFSAVAWWEFEDCCYSSSASIMALSGSRK